MTTTSCVPVAVTSSIISLRALSLVTFGASMLVFGSGCGLLSAAANPKVAWAINDPAPMTVVVRRADAAEKTATEVDRLLAQTPADGDAAWVQKTAPDQAEAQTFEDDLATNNPLYRDSHARVVAAEVWVKTLSSIKPASPPAQPVQPAAAPAPAAPPADAAVATADEPAPKKKGKHHHHRGDKAADTDKKAAKVDPKAADTDDANAAPSTATATATPTTTPTTSATATPAAPAAPTPAASLLGAVDPALADKYTAIMESRAEITSMKEIAAGESAALEQKNLSAEDKKAHEDTKAKADKQAELAEARISPLQKELVSAAKTSAQKASPDVRQKVGPALVNLRQAADDAGIANGAAAVRYPLAAPSMLKSVQAMVPIFVADIIEEQTGKRPSLNGLQPNVTLDGMKPKVTLNGLDQNDMGKISMGELTEQTVSRTEKWVEHALGLLGTIAATSDTLDFEKDVLDALLDGFKAGGWTAPAPATVPEPKASKTK